MSSLELWVQTLLRDHRASIFGENPSAHLYYQNPDSSWPIRHLLVVSPAGTSNTLPVVTTARMANFLKLLRKRSNLPLWRRARAALASGVQA